MVKILLLILFMTIFLAGCYVCEPDEEKCPLPTYFSENRDFIFVVDNVNKQYECCVDPKYNYIKD